MNILSISGGSTKIPFLAGASLELMRNKKYDVFVGSSSGALLSLALAVGNVRNVQSSVLNFGIKDIFTENPETRWGKIKAVWRAITKGYLFDQSRLYETIKEVVSKEEFDQWKDNPRAPSAHVCAINIETGSIVVVNLKRHDYEIALKWVMASASIPVFTSPIEIHGQKYVDGGLREHNPISSYMKKYPYSGANIDMVFSRPKDLSGIKKTAKGLIGTLTRTIEIMEWEISKSDEQIAKYMPDVEVNMYFAPRSLTSKAYETSRGQNLELYKLGQKAVCI